MHRTIFNLADEPSFIDFFLFLWGQKEPKLGYRKKEAGRAAPGRWQKASSGDEGTQKAKKARVAPKEKGSQSSSYRPVDTCAIFTESFTESSLSMYFTCYS